jgi:HTH-type transcriptional regulator / antitoxin HigA
MTRNKERVKTRAFELAELRPAWEGIRQKLPDLGPIRTKQACIRMRDLMERLLEEVGDDEDHKFADLLHIVSTLVMQYEDDHFEQILPAQPREVLKFLMAQHGMRQGDLKKEIGSQGVVSEILSGSRELNTRQIRALAKRFAVSPAVFLGS